MMISKKALRIASCALSLTVACTVAGAQEIKQVSPDAPTAEKSLRPAPVRAAAFPYSMSCRQRDAILARLSPELGREANHLGIDIASQRRLSSIQNNCAAVVKELQVERAKLDVDGLVPSVLLDGYEETQVLVDRQTAKVQHYNEMKSRDRPWIEQARAEKWEVSQTTTVQTVLSTIGDDAQLANIDLKDAVQKQQQT